MHLLAWSYHDTCFGYHWCVIKQGCIDRLLYIIVVSWVCVWEKCTSTSSCGIAELENVRLSIAGRCQTLRTSHSQFTVTLATALTMPLSFPHTGYYQSEFFLPTL